MFEMFKRGVFIVAGAALAGCAEVDLEEDLTRLAAMNETVQTIRITRDPANMAYEQNDPGYTLEGIEVRGKKSNGTEVSIDGKDLRLLGFNSAELGVIETWVVLDKNKEARARLYLSIVRQNTLGRNPKIMPYIAPEKDVRVALDGKTEALAPGFVAASAGTAKAGEDVELILNTRTGFELTKAGYKRLDENGKPSGDSLPLPASEKGDNWFKMPPYGIALYGEFALKEYTARVDVAVKSGKLMLETDGRQESEVPARMGDIVSVTAEGGLLKNPSYTYIGGESARVETGSTEEKDGKYRFVMPPGDATVSGAFDAGGVKNVAVEQAPGQTACQWGGTPSLIGIRVRITYDDNSAKWIRNEGGHWKEASGAPDGKSPAAWRNITDPGLTVKLRDAALVGSQTAVLTIGGKTAEFAVTVADTGNAAAVKWVNAAGEERRYADLSGAYDAASKSPDASPSLIILKDTSGGRITLSTSKRIELGAESARTLTGGAVGLFKLEAENAALTVKAPLTIKSEKGSAIVELAGKNATFTLDGGVLCGGQTGVKISGENAVFTMKGGGIEGCGTGVNLSAGSFTMEGGSISGGGTGVDLRDASFTMKGGIIEHNTKLGVYYVGGSTFTMGGSAVVGTDNKIEMDRNKSITVITPLNPAPHIVGGKTISGVSGFILVDSTWMGGNNNNNNAGGPLVGVSATDRACFWPPRAFETDGKFRWRARSTKGGVTSSIEDNGDELHIFTGTGNFTFEVKENLQDVSVLVVAGGGGGGWSGTGTHVAGGGGAGGLIYETGLSLPTGTYPVTVGKGGAGGKGDDGSNGGDSSFDSFTATGGGGGSQHAPNVPGQAGSGGSGGGSLVGSNGGIGAGIPGQGNDGARSSGAAGGGGGAGAPGEGVTNWNTLTGSGGGGGEGRQIPIGWDAKGDALRYAGGGASGLSGAKGGAGGGGNPKTDGTANTGGGGGGGLAGAGGAGGSGVVIIRIPRRP